MSDFFTRLRRAHRLRSRGQSIVELTLILPVLLLLTLIAIDFGRVYLGWVNLQNMSRIAADYAANHPEGWEGAGDPAIVDRYRDRILTDASFNNCTLPDRNDPDTVPNEPEDVPDPVFASGYGLQAPVYVGLTCQFAIVTPIISNILGSPLDLSAHAVFPITAGALASVPGGGGAPITPPVADFIGSPISGYAPLTVDFTDTSTGNPTYWSWSFDDPPTQFTKNPTHVYVTPGVYSVSLTVSNSGGFDSITRTDYIEVLAPPTTGPIPEFSASPRSGLEPLAVSFQDESTPTGTITAWEWDFDGNGITDSPAQNPDHTYSSAGTYNVSLTVTSPTGSNTQTKVGFIVVGARVCTVPNFSGARKNEAQDIWAAAGFATTVMFDPGNGNYVIQDQSLPGNLVDPPGGCALATITVGPS